MEFIEYRSCTINNARKFQMGSRKGNLENCDKAKKGVDILRIYDIIILYQ